MRWMQVDFKNKLEEYQKIEKTNLSAVELVGKIFSTVENTMNSYLPMFSRKRRNEESMDGAERVTRMRMMGEEDVERIEMTRVENGGSHIENGGNQIENGAINQIQNAAINQTQDEENIE